jgi:hypothetical protein
MFNQKDKERVLKHLLSLANPKNDRIVMEESELFTIAAISEKDFTDYLTSLKKDSYISFDIRYPPTREEKLYVITILPDAKGYFPEKEERERVVAKQRRTDTINHFNNIAIVKIIIAICNNELLFPLHPPFSSYIKIIFSLITQLF